MESSKNIFRKSFDKLAGEVKMTPEIMIDIEKFKGDMKEGEKLVGGKSDKLTLRDIAKKHTLRKGGPYNFFFYVDLKEKELKKQLKKGIKVEMEHTNDESKAKEIAMDHLSEDPEYYSKLQKIEAGEATGSGSAGAFEGPLFGGDTGFIKKSQSETPHLRTEGVEAVEKVEATEATGTGSSGAYETPAAWAKSTSKKDWGAKKKTQYPGGKFVSIKKKCTKFPYCNQGDIKALKIYENENVLKAIKSVSEKLQIKENTIKAILQYELERHQIK